MNRLISRSLIAVFALFVLFCVPSIASADGISWVLTGVTFDDGGTASGSFVYDAVTNTYSAISVTTTTGATLAGATYTSLSDIAGSSSTGFLFGPNNSSDLTGASFLMWLFDAPLTNSGVVQVSLPPPTDSIEGLCISSDCLTFSSRTVTGGEVVGTAVATPEPATFSLVGMGLVALLAGAAIRKVLLA